MSGQEQAEGHDEWGVWTPEDTSSPSEGTPAAVLGVLFLATVLERLSLLLEGTAHLLLGSKPWFWKDKISVPLHPPHSNCTPSSTLLNLPEPVSCL